MIEPDRVAELMHGLLQRPGARRAGVGIGTQARKRDQRHTPMPRGQSEDEIEAIDVEIEIGHAEHARSPMPAKRVEDGICAILPPSRIIGTRWRLFAVGCRRIEAGLGKVFGQHTERSGVGPADWNDHHTHVREPLAWYHLA